MELAFIGLGQMGRPMVGRLLEAGHTVRVHNRSPGAVEALAAGGAIPATSAADAATGAEIVMTCLPTVASVRTVYDELVDNARADQVYVDHSTVDMATSRACAERLDGRFLDAPVSGGPGGATAGTLTVMVGGDQVVFDLAESVFEAYGSTIRLCGPTGAGTAVKLVNQLLVGIHTAASAEAVALGSALGATPEVVADLIGQSFGASAMLSRNIPRFVSRDFSGATPVGILCKDLEIILAEGRHTDIPLPLGATAEQRFLEARARGWRNDDMAGLIRLWDAPQ